ncbi:phosphoribosyl-dephospho-CoA transferase MdcG domain-containing protein [Fluoribacter dumoffii]|uniref:Phosphoribosyl-dephospho-CoA transferase n=1 Tax=Fluoribacter dumoffii TaxID=463 RepID=A0A377GCY0_9GAMM|nr:phosphoribosyl-dephospho-CoA transferase MdcG domain-containing protein [Fluoribacter dumoffii]KTC90680.1 nucleotidyltransferase [Fluoribacter dumoffii NY 23]STO22361.1 phosphoribosyl-dephospho-CoA transferase [Fluoribacter dumoffii]
MNPQRHHLIYLNPDAEITINSCHADQRLIKNEVLYWLNKGLPCIYATQIPLQKKLNLGLTLLLQNKKQRVGLQVDPLFVQKQTPPPQLHRMQDFFSCHYGINDLKSFMPPVANIAVYGSFLFHFLSGCSFVTPDSDLDLLIHYQGQSWVDLHNTIDELTHKFNRPIDGEVRFSLFGDIPIKELLDVAAEKVLCKSKEKVELLAKAELYEHYPLL